MLLKKVPGNNFFQIVDKENGLMVEMSGRVEGVEGGEERKGRGILIEPKSTHRKSERKVNIAR